MPDHSTRAETPAHRGGLGGALDNITGHRLYVLGASVIAVALGMWIAGRVDVEGMCLAVVTAGALIGGTELTGAARDAANRPRAPRIQAPDSDITAPDATIET